ncbi:MAG: PD-(D/E)XK nuclease family protein, partial [Nocardioides sp.]|nr:PD-(D/E)XK nuclease family protein [Nocardioides sp.]
MTVTVAADPWEDARPKRLSPSRAGDFLQCPRMYAAKVVDKIPDPPTAAQAKGVLVHQVLEDLYGWPVAHRTLENAQAHLAEAWVKVVHPDENRDYLDHMDAWGYDVDRLFSECAALL